MKREPIVYPEPRDPLENIASPVPPELAEADDILTRYGRWVVTSSRGGSSAPTLERQFRAEMDTHESLASWLERCSRVPRDVLMPTRAALLVQRILARLPDRERIVLAALYVPRRIPAAKQLEILKISPHHSRALHLHGLRRFDVYRQMVLRTEGRQ